MTATDSVERRATLGRREVIMGGALLAAGGIAFARTPRRSQSYLGSAQLEKLVPRTIGPWSFATTSGLVLPPEDQLSDAIYEQLLTRLYTRPDGTGVMLLIAYSAAEDGVLQVHRPEVCYPAGGYRLSRVEDRETRLAPGLQVPSRFITAESDVRGEQMIYWTRLGQHFPTSWSKQRLAVIEENLAGNIPDGVLVRISMVTSDDASPLSSFAADLFGSVGAQMKRVLVGAP